MSSSRPAKAAAPTSACSTAPQLLLGNIVDLQSFLAYDPAFTGGVYVAANTAAGGTGGGPPGERANHHPDQRSHSGPGGDCGVPLTAVGAALNFTTSEAQAKGHLTAWSSGGTFPSHRW